MRSNNGRRSTGRAFVIVTAALMATMLVASSSAMATSTMNARVVGKKTLMVRGLGPPRGGNATDHFISVLYGPGNGTLVTNDGFADVVTFGSTCTLIAPNSDVSCPAAGVTRLQINTANGIDEVETQNVPLPAKIFTEKGDDQVDSGAGADFINTKNGLDVINSGDGADRIYSGNDADQIDAGTGVDLISAGDGDDTIFSVDNVADRVHCGSGNDTVFIDSLDAAHLGHDCEPGNVTVYPPTP